MNDTDIKAAKVNPQRTMFVKNVCVAGQGAFLKSGKLTRCTTICLNVATLGAVEINFFPAAGDDVKMRPEF